MTYRIHGHPLSSYCWKAHIAFYEAGVPFEPIVVNLGDPAARAVYAKISPLCKIPTLEDVGRSRVVNETSLIIEYLAINQPSARSLLPPDAMAALPVHWFDRFFDNYVMTPMNKIVADTMRPEGSHDPFGVADARRQLGAAYDVLEERLPKTGFAAGAAFTLADCAACPSLFYADQCVPFETTHPNLWAYFERLNARPSFQRALAEKEPVFHMYPGPRKAAAK